MDPYLALTIGLCVFVVIGMVIVAEYISRDCDQ